MILKIKNPKTKIFLFYNIKQCLQLPIKFLLEYCNINTILQITSYMLLSVALPVSPCRTLNREPYGMNWLITTRSGGWLQQAKTGRTLGWLKILKIIKKTFKFMFSDKMIYFNRCLTNISDIAWLLHATFVNFLGLFLMWNSQFWCLTFVVF